MSFQRAPTRTVLCAAAILLAAPATAAPAAEFLIPEDNSAVNQYTEGFPTGGGDRDADDPDRAAKPGKTIGAAATNRLRQAGPEGEAAALVAAETAPPVGDGNGGSRGRDSVTRNRGGHSRNGGGEPEGAPPVGELAATATGTASGIGLLLPLAIVATLVWGVGHAWRNRGGSGPAAGL